MVTSVLPRPPAKTRAGLIQDTKAVDQELREKYQIRRKQIEDRRDKIDAELAVLRDKLKRLGDEEKRQIGALWQRLEENVKVQPAQPEPTPRHGLPADKLDRILEKLEQMERRLDRLERAR